MRLFSREKRIWWLPVRLDKVALYGFRNYRELKAEFDPGVNLILGDNAQGKTNLLEAMVYLSTGKSFRTRKEQELILFGAEFADLNGFVTSGDRQQTLRAVLFASRRPRQLFLNEVKKKSAGELSGVLTTVIFCPEDLLILKTGSSARRRFMDSALEPLRPNYEKALAEYSRLLDQKSKILKERFENPQYLEILPEYSERMCQVGALIISYRARFLKGLGEAAQGFHREFTGGMEKLNVEYKTVSTVADPFAPVSELTDILREHMESHRRAELETCQCLSGPHKDDFDVTLDGISLKSFGSQGQIRTAVISLKLAQRELMGREFGEEPVLLLDDVLSELDPSRQNFILNKIKTGQVFITCCESDRITQMGKTIHIEKGHLAD